MRTERLTLSHYGVQDFGVFLALVLDPVVMANVDGPADVAAARSLFERVLTPGTPEHTRTWAVRIGNVYVGHAWLSADEPVPEIGLALLEAAWGRGLGVEVATALLAHAHETLGLAIVTATVDPEHTRSRRVLEKAGMNDTGLREDAQGPYAVYESCRARPT